MSLARAAGAVVRPSKRAGTTLLQRRAASSHAHDEHHHEEYHDTNVYEPEGAFSLLQFRVVGCVLTSDVVALGFFSV